MSSNPHGLGIAIVGMSCLFPGADGPDHFWRNICAGIESLTEITDEELAADGTDPAVAGAANYVRLAACIEGADLFDAGFFGISPREAELMDPQQRLFLEHCWRAIEVSGYDPTRLDLPVGVYAGSGVNTYIDQVRANADVLEMSARGADVHEIGSVENEPDYLATRVSYKLNLTGPSINMMTACSTSLVAVHMAIQALRTFDCDMALAGGIAVTPPLKAGYLYHEGTISSADGHTRSFDAAATGTVLGSGVGVVLLKRLEDALADGDTVHAVITGSAVNNDGSDKAGFTAPGVPGQAAVIATAHAIAGLTADMVTYQEAHGTATRIGDPIEVRALTQAFRETTESVNYCALGSVKANIGHMDAAAGVAGLIKATMAVKHGIIPPQINFTQPNPGLQLDTSPFYVNTELKPWSVPDGSPRRAGVSAFGFGGTNAHVVIEQAPEPPVSAESAGWQILPVAARGDAAVSEYLRALASRLDPSQQAPGELGGPGGPGDPGVPLADVAATLQTGRTRFGLRAAVVARTGAEAAEALRARAELPPGQAGDGQTCFLYPGQGTQYPRMGQGLYASQPVFRAEFDRCAELFLPVLGEDLRTILAAPPVPGTEQPVDRTRLTQPVLFAVEYALTQTLAAYGVRPAAMIGHSLGEIVAATIAGVFTLEDAVRVVAKRAALMDDAPGGGMLAVALSAAEVEPLLPAGVSIAAYNAPRLIAVTGETDAIGVLAAELSERGIKARRLHVSCASHSALMDAPAREFAEFLRGISMSPPSALIVSNVTGDVLTAAEACDPDYWGRHLRGAVHFSQGLERVTAMVGGPLLEVGPGGGLLSMARSNPAAVGERALVGMMRHPKDPKNSDDDDRVFMAGLAALWEAGVEPDWSGGAPRTVRRVPLPTYPFQRRRYWLEASSSEDLQISRKLIERENDPGRWLYSPSWRQLADARHVRPGNGTGPAWSRPESVMIIADGPDGSSRSRAIADCLGHRLRADGTRCVILADGNRYLRHADDLVELSIADSDYLQLALTEGHPDLDHTALVFLAGGRPGEPASASLALLSLGKALAELNWAGELLVVTHGAFSVLGHEDPDPAGWLLDGIARVMPREVSGLSCRVVDIEPGQAADGVAACLAAELGAHQPDAALAYRHGRRWLRGVEALATGAGTMSGPGTAAPRGPREGGVYLITGGLGGIGLSIAEFLAERYRARLVLTGISPFPEPAHWDAWIAEHGAENRTSRRIARLRRIEQHGGAVLAMTSDVCDPAAVAELIARTEQHFGGLDGILHAAGLPGGGLIQALDHQAYLRVLAPKVTGGQLLLDATQGRHLDFLMLFSSLNVVDGRFGIADYTAANSYLDGLAYRARHRGRSEVLAVDWTGWRDLGMALDAGSTTEGNEDLREVERLTVMSEAGMASFMSEAEGHETFLRTLELGLPQVHVSTQDLDAVVKRGRQLDVAVALTALEESHRQGIAHERPDIGTEYVPPSDKYEAFVCETLQLVLGIERVGAHDNFYALGGSSLLVLDVIAQAKRRFGTEIAVSSFLAQPTPQGMAALLAQTTPTPALDALT
jgi:phthiocerol/phenolphthiocerol synthesis type-I polyketide synthase E